MMRKPRVLVVGSGAIGGTVATAMAHAGTAEVHLLARNPRVADALEARGLQTCGVGPALTGRATVHRGPPDGAFDAILLATPPQSVEAAAAAVIGCLTAEGLMVVLANGVCEPRIEPICGAARVAGGIVTFGATTATPGVFERTSTGGIVLGRLDGSVAGLDGLERALRPVGAVSITTNLLGARFSKLAVNCAVSGLGTVAGSTVGTMLTDRRARNLALAAMREAVAVSAAEGIELERLNGTVRLEWLANPQAATAGPSHWLRHAVLIAIGLRYRRLRSSMLRAIETGRTPPVDFVNGEVARRGQRLGIPTPVNAAATRLVHEIARGATASSLGLLRSLA
ncbi:MAG: ketopantoate reductase C-terminal domain-containing protein [Myxococcota bacterium]|nr:ketopantoate reductase C-terminal domain-containing protein [Myxococcota bacterium]